MASPVKNRHFYQSLAHAWRGVSAISRSERNFRIDLIGAIGVGFCGWWCHLTRRDWLWLVLACGLVLGFEALNSALEALVRVVVGDGFDPDPRVAKVLDMAAGAVLIAAIAAAVIGVLVFWPYLFGGHHG